MEYDLIVRYSMALTFPVMLLVMSKYKDFSKYSELYVSAYLSLGLIVLDVIYVWNPGRPVSTLIVILLFLLWWLDIFVHFGYELFCCLTR